MALEKVKLKQLLGLDESSTQDDLKLQFILEDVEETILNYCHIKEISKGLERTAYRMAIDLYRNENLGDENMPLGSISSIGEGDTSVHFRSTVDEGFKESLLKDYRSQLNSYRKLVKHVR
jgi:hypothetical protein